MSISDDIAAELSRARLLYPKHPTLEHAYCVIDEERREVRRIVEHKPGQRDYAALRVELVQLAAMAVRAIEDVVDPVLSVMRLDDPTFREASGCQTCRHDGVSKGFCASCPDGGFHFDTTRTD